MKVIFVGDEPSFRMKAGAKPFEGAACEKRLKEWIKSIIQCEDYEVVNRGDLRLSAFMTLSMYDQVEYKFIALGNRASETLNGCDIPHLKLPHPSGRNRQINDKTFIENKLKEAREYINSRQK